MEHVICREHGSMKPYGFVFFVFCVIECFVLVLMFRLDAVPLSLVSVLLTAVFLPLLVKLWTRVLNPKFRFAACLFFSWLGVVVMTVVIMLMTPDPFASRRIAEKDWLLYVLLDKVVRGLLFGIFFSSLAFSWLWIPLGALCYFLLRRELRNR